MKSIITILIVSFVLYSCNTYLDKPITKELTLKEINSSLEVDSLIYNLNNNIFNKLRDTFNSDLNLKSKFNLLTYGDYYDYTSLVLNEKYFDSIKNNFFKPKWEKEYGYVVPIIDSLYKSYYSNPINLSDYVKVELSNINTDYYSYSGNISDVSIGFQLTPLKGRIQQIIFEYSYKRKIGGKKYSHRLVSTRPFSKKVSRYWEVDYSEKSILGGETTKSIKRDYDFEIDILKIRYNNENLSNDESDIPFEIRMKKKYTELGNEGMVSLYDEDISNEILEIPFKSLNKYFSTKRDSIIKNKIKNLELIFELNTLNYELTKKKVFDK